MSQPPIPRGPLGQLLDQAKGKSGWEWRDVERESGISVTTIQAWISGRTAEPPLRGLLHLAKILKIPPKDLMDKALEGYVPPLEQRANGVPAGAPSAAGVADSSEAIAARADAEAKRGQQKRGRRAP